MAEFPSGWYPDPSGDPGAWRWWDGRQWGVQAPPGGPPTAWETWLSSGPAAVTLRALALVWGSSVAAGAAMTVWTAMSRRTLDPQGAVASIVAFEPLILAPASVAVIVVLGSARTPGDPQGVRWSLKTGSTWVRDRTARPVFDGLSRLGITALIASSLVCAACAVLWILFGENRTLECADAAASCASALADPSAWATTTAPQLVGLGAILSGIRRFTRRHPR